VQDSKFTGTSPAFVRIIGSIHKSRGFPFINIHRGKEGKCVRKVCVRTKNASRNSINLLQARLLCVLRARVPSEISEGQVGSRLSHVLCQVM